MSYQTNVDDGRELVLDNRRLIIIFAILLVVCGIFFIAGVRIGRDSSDDLAVNMEYDPSLDDAALGGSADDSSQSAGRAGELEDAETEDAAPATPAVSDSPAPTAAASPSTPPPTQVAAASTPAAPPAAQEKPQPSPKPQETPKPKVAPKEQPAGPVERIVKEAAKKVMPPATPVASAGSTWSVQVAAFHARREVERKAKELESAGFSPRIEVPHPPDDWYRLKIGKFATRAEANEMANRVKGSGFDAIVKENKEE